MDARFFPPSKIKEAHMVHFKVNGVERSFDGDPEMPLLWYLRDVLGLTGTKFGCGMALCGACTVHLDGTPTRSCITSIYVPMGRADSERPTVCS
jgi:aerobic-type carbon monoxide dehydrogenase small subunit (CoxS/CutS family)